MIVKLIILRNFKMEKAAAGSSQLSVALAENLLQQLGDPRSRIGSDFLLLPAYHEEESVKGPVGYVLIKVVFFLLYQGY